MVGANDRMSVTQLVTAGLPRGWHVPFGLQLEFCQVGDGVGTNLADINFQDAQAGNGPLVLHVYEVCSMLCGSAMLCLRSIYVLLCPELTGASKWSLGRDVRPLTSPSFALEARPGKQ